MAMGNLPVLGRPTIWVIVGQGLSALAVGADGGCLDTFTLIYPFSPLPSSLRNPKQPTNQLRERLSICVFASLLFGFVGGMWDLTVVYVYCTLPSTK